MFWNIWCEHYIVCSAEVCVETISFCIFMFNSPNDVSKLVKFQWKLIWLPSKTHLKRFQTIICIWFSEWGNCCSFRINKWSQPPFKQKLKILILPLRHMTLLQMQEAIPDHITLEFNFSLIAFYTFSILPRVYQLHQSVVSRYGMTNLLVFHNKYHFTFTAIFEISRLW